MHLLWKSLGLTIFFFGAVMVVVFLANFRLNLNHDAFYESPATKTVAPSLTTTRFWHNLYRWDAGWYWNVAVLGYHDDNATFFPLYPLTLRALMHFQTGADKFPNSALFVSFITVWAIAYLLQKLAQRDEQDDHTYPVLLFLFFPTAMFLAAPYSEGLFIALLLGFVLAIQTRTWWAAFVIGILLGLTRVAGLALVLYPLYLAWENRHDRDLLKKFGLLTLSPLIGTGIFATFQYFQLGNALAFITTQNSWGRTTTANFFAIAANYAKDWRDFMSLSLFHPRFIGWGLNYIFVIVGLGFTAWLWRVRRDYGIICIAIISLPLLSGTTHSFPRLLLPAIPFVALVIGHKIKNPTARSLLLIMGVAGWTFLLLLFTRGYWVA